MKRWMTQQLGSKILAPHIQQPAAMQKVQSARASQHFEHTPHTSSRSSARTRWLTHSLSCHMTKTRQGSAFKAHAKSCSPQRSCDNGCAYNSGRHERRLIFALVQKDLRSLGKRVAYSTRTHVYSKSPHLPTSGHQKNGIECAGGPFLSGEWSRFF